jgi:Flp pilus assembly protein TadG
MIGVKLMKFFQQLMQGVGGICRPRRRGEKPRGVAAAELAVCLPVVVLIVIATIEACSAIFLKQSLTVAAYEGARTALAERQVAGSVQGAIDQILTDRNVRGATVTISPADIASLRPGDFFDVTVSAPCNSNSLVPTTFYRGRTLSATASMMVEN